MFAPFDREAGSIDISASATDAAWRKAIALEISSKFASVVPCANAQVCDSETKAIIRATRADFLAPNPRASARASHVGKRVVRVFFVMNSQLADHLGQ